MKSKSNKPELSQDERDVLGMENCKDLGTLEEKFGCYDQLMTKYINELKSAPDPSVIPELQEKEVKDFLKEKGKFLLIGYDFYMRGRKGKALSELVPGFAEFLVEEINKIEGTELEGQSIKKLTNSAFIKKSVYEFLASGASYARFLAVVRTGKVEQNDEIKEEQKLIELFSNTEDYNTAISVLQSGNKSCNPLIDSHLRFIAGRNEKAGFAAWFQVLKNRGMIKHIEYKKLSKILEREFSGLSISEEVLRRPGKTFNDKYTTHFTNKL